MRVAVNNGAERMIRFDSQFFNVMHNVQRMATGLEAQELELEAEVAAVSAAKTLPGA